ncbi:MAG: S8 family serine peptidase, partial [Hydrogenobacter sp.]
MKKTLILSGVLSLAYLLSSCGGAPSADSANTSSNILTVSWLSIEQEDPKAPQYVPNELLVKFKDGVKSSYALKAVGDMGDKVLQSVELGGSKIYRIKLSAQKNLNYAYAQYLSMPEVEKVGLNYIRKLEQVYPADPLFGDQWYLSKIEAPNAWSKTKCMIDKPEQSLVVAVLDTGVNYLHPDLAGAMWRSYSTCNDGASGCFGWDFFDDDPDPMDYNGHGTHLAGIIGAIWSNSVGTAGLCPGVKIMAVRVCGAGRTCNDFSIIKGIKYAVDNGARIINMSFGGYGGYDGDFEYDAINYAADRGVLVVASAGNEANDNDKNPVYPASYSLPNIISVAATDRNDNLAPFSNYGRTKVHIAAPGVDILSTYNRYLLTDR